MKKGKYRKAAGTTGGKSKRRTAKKASPKSVSRGKTVPKPKEQARKALRGAVGVLSETDIKMLLEKYINEKKKK